MTRECDYDFEMFKKYISEYNISQNLEQKSYLISAKKIHKIYFSLVSWHVEYRQKIVFFENKYTNSKDILLRISETISDIGSSKFNWLNGSYKASRVMLRSSIENFIRAISAIDDEAQIAEKNVSRLFDKAKDCNVFNTSVILKESYRAIHSKYKELCKDTHTESDINMEGITSLVDYPKYIQRKSDNTADVFIFIVKNILIILCTIFSDLYHSMHYKNKENIIDSIPRNIRPSILMPES